MNRIFKILLVAILFFGFSMQAFTVQSFDDKKKEIIALYNQNNIDEAYSLITKITEDERDYELWFLLANISQDKGNSTNAIFFLQKSINLNPNFDKAHYNLGNIYLEEKKYNLAINEYKQAIRTKKDFAYYYYNMGCAYLGLKDFKNAKNAFIKAIKIKPDVSQFYYNLALSYKNLNNEKEMQKALDEYNKLKEKEF